MNELPVADGVDAERLKLSCRCDAVSGGIFLTGCSQAGHRKRLEKR